MAGENDERSPLLQNGLANGHEDRNEEVVNCSSLSLEDTELIPVQIVDFSKEDEENPRNWPRGKKFLNVGIIAFMAGLPLIFHQSLFNLQLTDRFNISPFTLGLFNVHPRYSPDS